MVVMDEVTVQLGESTEPQETTNLPLMPTEPAPPIGSRFLFVDVAALRAKQLRRGAQARFETEPIHAPLKPERVAMEEVRRGLVPYTVPPWRRFSAASPPS